MSEKQLFSTDFFFCYTVGLSRYLKKNGLPYILKGKSVKDDSVFTLYQRTDELEKLLIQFNTIDKQQKVY